MRKFLFLRYIFVVNYDVEVVQHSVHLQHRRHPCLFIQLPATKTPPTLCPPPTPLPPSPHRFFLQGYIFLRRHRILLFWQHGFFSSVDATSSSDDMASLSSDDRFLLFQPHRFLLLPCFLLLRCFLLLPPPDKVLPLLISLRVDNVVAGTRGRHTTTTYGKSLQDSIRAPHVFFTRSTAVAFLYGSNMYQVWEIPGWCNIWCTLESLKCVGGCTEICNGICK
jgi:hypothetical protein